MIQILTYAGTHDVFELFFKICIITEELVYNFQSFLAKEFARIWSFYYKL